jgi:uncharacterized protein
MKIIIPGGTGLIGSFLSQKLADDGYEIIVLTRNNKHKDKKVHAGIRFELWDGKTSTGWGDLVNGAFAIINLAGENISSGRWTRERKQSILESRVDAGNAVVEAIKVADQKPAIVIQSSAVGYYGVHKDDVVDETNDPGDDFLSKVCIDWENSSRSVTEYGVKHIVIRLGVVLSKSGGALPKMILPFKFFAGGPVGTGDQFISWIHPEDVAEAILFLMKNPTNSGIFNLSSIGSVNNREFSKAIGAVLQRPSFMPVPAIVLKSIFGEMSTVLLDGQRVMPSNLLNLGYQFRFPDINIALKEILQK